MNDPEHPFSAQIDASPVAATFLVSQHPVCGAAPVDFLLVLIAVTLWLGIKAFRTEQPISSREVDSPVKPRATSMQPPPELGPFPDPAEYCKRFANLGSNARVNPEDVALEVSSRTVSKLRVLFYNCSFHRAEDTLTNEGVIPRSAWTRLTLSPEETGPLHPDDKCRGEEHRTASAVRKDYDRCSRIVVSASPADSGDCEPFEVQMDAGYSPV